MNLTAKKFFIVCVFISAAIFFGPLAYRNLQAPSEKFDFDYDQPFVQKITESLSTDITTCQFPVTDVKLEFEAEVVLAERFLTLPLSSELVTEAAQMQLRYLFGYFNLNKESKQKRIFLTSKVPEIKIVSQKSSAYPESLIIDNYWHDEPWNAYLKQAFEKLKLKREEKAVSIKYQAVISAITCGPLYDKKIKITLPKDPYLAYWAVAYRSFIDTKFRSSRAIVNPCADAELAEIKKVKWFWYTWSPANKNCEASISQSRFYNTVYAQVTTDVAQTKVRPDFFPIQNEYEVSLVFGTLYNDSIDQTMGFLKKNLTEKNIYSVHAPWRKLDRVNPFQETTLLGLTYFFKELPGLMVVKQTKIEWFDDRSFQVLVSGTQSNGKKINLKVYYGMTSIDFRQSPSYIQFALNAFKTSDFVFYTGHAGMGKNFSLAFLAEKSGQSLADIQQLVSTKRNQGFVIVSCYSNIYFGEDIMQARRERQLPTLLVRSASQDYIFHTSLGLLNFLRQPDLNTYSLKSFIAPLDLGQSVILDYY